MKKIYFIYVIVILFLPQYVSGANDSLSLEDRIQIKLLTQKVDFIQKEVDKMQQKNEEYQSKYKEEIEKVIEDKNNNIQEKLNLYLAFFLALLTAIGAFIRYFGKGTIEKWVKQQIDEYLKSRISDPIIDSKISELGKPIIEKLLNQIEVKKNEYDKLYDELKSRKFTDTVPADKERIKEFSKILDEVKNENLFSDWDWNFKGVEQANKNNYEHAVFYYSKAIEKNPTEGIFYCNRAHGKYFLNQFENAIKDYNKSIEIGDLSTLVEAYSGKAASLNKMEKHHEAIENATLSIQLGGKSSNTEHPNPYRHRAYAKMKLGNYKEALDDVNLALSINPEYTEAVDLKNEIEKYI